MAGTEVNHPLEAMVDSITGDVGRTAARRMATRIFVEAGLETPEPDARRLSAFALALDDLAFITDGNRPIGAQAASALREAIRRRLAHMPVSRIIGTREFYGLPFRITDDVLDPRPETETVVEVVSAALQSRQGPLRIADIGTGSGAIIVSLLSAHSDAVGVATDISSAALSVARQNAAAIGVADRVEFVETSALSGVDGHFDAIVANPPYIRRGEIAGLAPEVVRHDPMVALDGGPDGLAAYREISLYNNMLKPGGLLALEVGSDQAGDVARLFQAAGLHLEAIHKDLSGHERVVAMIRHS